MKLLNMTYRMNLNSINKILLPAIICLGMNVCGQEDNPPDPYQYNPSDKMFLPTPEQASLLKFTNIPPGSHTGVQGYSVPIYTIQGKGFTLPISIDYHGMGVKVNEVSGSVGIGWALNAGGISLSQEVRGERDQGIERLSYFNPSDFQPIKSPPNTAYINGLHMLALAGSKEYSPDKELHPDYYSYSLLNNSGRFMLDNLDKAHTIPKDNIKIVGNNSFVLTDSKGLVYHFSNYLQESALYGNGVNHVGGIVQTRENYGNKLERIEIPHLNETITFTYYHVEYAYASSHTVTDKVSVSAVNGGVSINPSGSNTIATVTEYLPRSIEYNNVKVEFKYKMNGPDKLLGRQDLDFTQSFELDGNQGGVLEYIEVWDKANNIKLKNYHINTDYFISSDDESLPEMWGATTTRASLLKRLKLEGIHETFSDTKYDFEYFGELELVTLPPRFSYQVDFWGMHNGKVNNNTELHNYAITTGGRKYFFPGSDKNPDLTFARIGALKKVFLPTGGYQEFEYELDEFKNTVFPDDNTTFHAVHNYIEREFQVDTSEGNLLNVLIPITAVLPDYRTGFSHKLEFHYPCNPNNDLPPDGLPDGFDEYYRLELHEGTNDTTPTWFFKDRLGEQAYDLGQLDPTKDYFFKIIKIGQPSCPGNPDYPVLVSSIFIKLKWVDDNVSYPPNRNAGTLRVKSITLNDKNGNDLIKRSYAYKEFGNSAFSSGKFTGRQLSEHYTTKEAGIDVYNVTNNDMFNLTQSFGKSVLYTNVTETYESINPLESGNNHKKEYIFSPSTIPGFSALSAPIVPEPHDYEGGMLLEERVFNSESDTLRITKNEYYNPDTFFNQFSGNSYSVADALSTALVISMGGWELEHPFEIKWYNIRSAWIKLKKTTVEEYENNTLVRSNYTEYAYNENTGQQNEFKSILPVSTITGTSLNNGTNYEEKLKTVYKYPQDLIGLEQTPYMQQLKDANIITEPVVTETFLLKTGAQEKKLSETHIKYNGLLPSEVHFRNGAGNINLNTIEDRKVRYSQYDANGNILEYIMEDGTPVAVVWGYNGQYPILKVEGVTYNSLDNAITTLDLHDKSNEDNDRCMGTSNECKEATLRGILMQMVIDLCAAGNFAQCPETMVTAYTYDPLVGITSVIQPNGQVQYYDYDTAGRLNEVYVIEMMDNVPVKTVLKKTKYNYQP